MCSFSIADCNTNARRNYLEKISTLLENGTWCALLSEEQIILLGRAKLYMNKLPFSLRIGFFLLVSLTGALQSQNSSLEQLPISAMPARDNSLFYTGVLGTIHKSTTPNTSRVHVRGEFNFTNADYSRAAFDGVPEELGNFAYSVTIAPIFQLLRSGSLFRQIAFTIGTQQGLTDNQLSSNQLQWWYEANFFSGFVFVFPHNISSAVSYLLATVPNAGAVANELELAVSYSGSGSLGQWNPSLEAAIPLSESRGFLIQAGVDPSIRFFQKSVLPLSLSFPLRIGAGLFGYHVPETDFSGYLSAGLNAKLSLKPIQDIYGRWEFLIGADLIARNDQLANVNFPDDKGGNVIVVGRVGFQFLY
jgi:hypothetical protein